MKIRRVAVTGAAILAIAGALACNGAKSTGEPGQPSQPSPTSTVVPKGATGYCTNGQYVFDKTHAKRVADCKRQGGQLAEETR